MPCRPLTDSCLWRLGFADPKRWGWGCGLGGGGRGLGFQQLLHPACPRGDVVASRLWQRLSSEPRGRVDTEPGCGTRTWCPMVEEWEARCPNPESQTGPPPAVSRHLRLSSTKEGWEAQPAVCVSVAGRGQLSPSSPRFPACSPAPAQVGDPQLDPGDDQRGRRGGVWMARLFRLPRRGLCPQEGRAVGGRRARGREPGSRWRAGGSCHLGGQPEGAALNAPGFLRPAWAGCC